jgi:hypothetical protein
MKPGAHSHLTGRAEPAAGAGEGCKECKGCKGYERQERPERGTASRSGADRFATQLGDPNADPLNSLPAFVAEKSDGGVALDCVVYTGS